MLQFIHFEILAKISRNKDARAKVLELIDRPSYVIKSVQTTKMSFRH